MSAEPPPEPIADKWYVVCGLFWGAEDCPGNPSSRTSGTSQGSTVIGWHGWGVCWSPPDGSENHNMTMYISGPYDSNAEALANKPPTC